MHTCRINSMLSSIAETKLYIEYPIEMSKNLSPVQNNLKMRKYQLKFSDFFCQTNSVTYFIPSCTIVLCFETLRQNMYMEYIYEISAQEQNILSFILILHFVLLSGTAIEATAVQPPSSSPSQTENHPTV